VTIRSKQHLAIGVALLVSQSAWAGLGSFGQTQLQQDTGDAVQKTCAGFVQSGTQPGTVPLFDTCRAMVHTGNDLSGSGPSRDSLGLNADELAASLQQIATEEFAATESMANEISSNRLNAVLGRLVGLRNGARGFSISGLTPENTSALAAADQRFESTAGRRGGGAGDDAFGSPLSGFANLSYGTGIRDGTDRTDSFDFSSYNITVGLDYRFLEHLTLGAAVNYFNIDSEFDNKPTVAGGDLDSDGWGGALYGTYYQDNFYIDGLVGYAASAYDVRRNIVIPSHTSVSPINETAKASPDSKDYSLSIGGGYSFNQGGLTYGPYARATYMKVAIDDYQEQGAEVSGLNLNVAGQDWKSFTTVLGAQFSYALSRKFGVLLPQGRLGWVHQFENDAQNMTATYVTDPNNVVLSAFTDDPDRDYFELGIGVSAVFQGGMQLFANYDTILGFKNLTDHLFTIGARLEF